jgi:prepilin-type N-terminal cleavage/methylation domain-containing protein
VPRYRKPVPKSRRGFTLIELLVGSAVMLVAVLGAMMIYARSNKVSVEQQMVTEIQNDVRSSMYFVTRDLRMAGVGIPPEFAAFYLMGTDNEDQGGGGEVLPDRIWMMGNIDDPLNLIIETYQGGHGGGSENVKLKTQSLEQYPYPDSFYDNKFVLVLPNPESPCRTGYFRTVSQIIHDNNGNNEGLGFAPGQSPGINPPGGLVQGACAADDFEGGMVTFANVKEYWLDTTGNFGLNAADGYIGGPEGIGVFYCTTVVNQTLAHLPIARNIENFQLEYNGDMDGDTVLDGWSPWNSAWLPDQIARIQQVRVMLLGRTPQPFTSIGTTPPGGIHLYRRPVLSNSPAATADDKHRRFLLESSSNVRNMTLNLYNIGQR